MNYFKVVLGILLMIFLLKNELYLQKFSMKKKYKADYKIETKDS
jgi:hypothetical protein